MTTLTFTTGQVAKHCKVCPRVVAQWVDSGRLSGYRIPGSQDRRIPRDALVEFMERHGLPTDNLPLDGAEVVLVTQDAILGDALAERLAPLDVRVTTAGNAFDAGLAMAGRGPSVLLVDFAMGDSAAALCRSVWAAETRCRVTVLAIVIGSEADGEHRGGYVREVFRRPVDIELLAARVAGRVHRAQGVGEIVRTPAYPRPFALMNP